LREAKGGGRESAGFFCLLSHIEQESRKEEAGRVRATGAKAERRRGKRSRERERLPSGGQEDGMTSRITQRKETAAGGKVRRKAEARRAGENS